MAFLTNFLVWDLFVVYMLICVTFLVSCCIWVSCMFLFYPARNQQVICRSEQQISHDENMKHGSIKSYPTSSSIRPKNEDTCNDNRNYRSKSINIIPLPQCSEHLTENKANELAILAVIEPCSSRSDQDRYLQLQKKQELS